MDEVVVLRNCLGSWTRELGNVVSNEVSIEAFTYIERVGLLSAAEIVLTASVFAINMDSKTYQFKNQVLGKMLLISPDNPTYSYVRVISSPALASAHQLRHTPDQTCVRKY
jgi:hypothetical protein